MTQTSLRPLPAKPPSRSTKYEAGTTVTLSGATFEVVGPDGDTIGVYTTPESGSITIPLTEVGNSPSMSGYPRSIICWTRSRSNRSP